MNKYNAKKTTRVVGDKVYTFDSMAESRYFDALVLAMKAGKIDKLKTQPRFKIAEAYMIDTTKTKSGKSKIGELNYTPDFEYIRDGKKIVVEVKGKVTTDYRLRMKLFLSCAYRVHGVSQFIEVIGNKSTVYDCETVKELK